MTTIRVYNGGGSSLMGVPRLIERLKNSLDSDVNISTIDAQEISTNMRWTKKDDVIIFGAASVRRFKKALGTQGLSNLYNAVADIGMSYAGICAGAAFAADQIVYDVIEGGKIIKLNGDGLKFFNGIARGPIKAITNGKPFEDSINDIHVIDVIRTQTGKSHKAAYWSGPLLIPHERGSLNAAFEATSFLKGTNVPLSVVGQHGKGRVVLYSVHPEMAAWNWRRWITAPNPNQFQQATLNKMDAYLDGQAFDYFIQDLGLSHLQIKRAGGLNLAALL